MKLNVDEELLDAARVMAPIVRANAEEGERERRLSKATFDALGDAGFLRLYVPKSLGEPCTGRPHLFSRPRPPTTPGAAQSKVEARRFANATALSEAGSPCRCTTFHSPSSRRNNVVARSTYGCGGAPLRDAVVCSSATM